MAKRERVSLVNFSGGEFSSLLHSRIDFNKYLSACAILENCFVYPHGPFSNRPGFRFMSEAETSSEKSRLIPFQFSTEQAYVLEFGNQYIRFYKDQGQIVLARADATEITTNGDVDNAGDAADYPALNLATIATGVAGGKSNNCLTCTENGSANPGFYHDMTVNPHSLYSLQFYSKQNTATEFTVGVYDVTNGAWIAWYDGGATQTAPAAWAASADIDFEFYTPVGCTQIYMQVFVFAANGSGDSMYFDEFTCKQLDEPYQIASPYLEAELYDIKYTQSADVVILTHPNWKPRNLNRTGHTAWNLWAPGDDASYTFVADPFGADASDDCPAVACFHENRLVFACTNNAPSDFWLSKSGSFYDFTTGAADDDAIEISLASDEVNAVHWLVSATILVIGTPGGSWKIAASDEDEPITPTNVTAKRISRVGSYNRMAIPVDDKTVFIPSTQMGIHKLEYKWEAGGYVSPELSILGRHVSKGTTTGIIDTGDGFIWLAYQDKPHGIIWAIRDDGALIGLTWLEEHDVVGWHRHPMDNGIVESICTIRGTNHDELWAIIKRTIDGSTVRNIEMMEYYFDEDDLATSATQDLAFFLDSGITISVSAPTNTISGPYLWPLIGETCDALIDGVHEEGIVVQADGSITTVIEIQDHIHIGLPYTQKWHSLPIESTKFNSHGLSKAISSLRVRAINTLEFEIGTDESFLEEISTGFDYMDTSAELLTGDTDVIDIAKNSGRKLQLKIVNEKPTPMTIGGIFFDLEVEDDL